MSIKIQMQDGQGNIIHPQTDAELVQYKASNVNEVLVELEEREQVFIQEVEPADDGLWVDTSESTVDNTGENIVATQIKKYIDEKITGRVDDCVEKVDEISKEVVSPNFNNIIINQSSIEVVDAKNGFTNNEMIEGNTLQNYWNVDKIEEVRDETSSHSRYVVYTHNGNHIEESGETYTIINISNYPVSFSCFNRSQSAWKSLGSIDVGEKKVFTLEEDFVFGGVYGTITNGWDSSNITSLYKSIIILKGDWSTKEVPNVYFHGLACVGEHQPILTAVVGKNICPPLELGNISYSTGADVPNDNLMRSKFIRVKPNTEYSCSNNGLSRGVNLYSFNQEKVLIKFDQAGDSNGNNIKFVTDSNTHYIRVTMGMNNSDKFQIEENSICSEYEPYREEIQLIHEPLRAIGNIKDTIDVDRGVITRRIGKIVLDGSETWNKFNDSGNGVNSDKWYFYTKQFNMSLTENAIADSLVYAKNSLLIEKSFYISPSLQEIGIRNYDYSTSEQLKTYLKANPITVLYELQTPVEEKINIAPLRLFEEARSIELVSNIKPTVTFNYPTNLKSIVESNINAINKLYDERTIASNPNLFINGDFKIWQRGTSFTFDKGGHQYTADRWKNIDRAGVYKFEKTNTGMRVTLLKNDTYNNRICQVLEDDNHQGRTLTLSMKVKVSHNNTFAINKDYYDTNNIRHGMQEPITTDKEYYSITMHNVSKLGILGFLNLQNGVIGATLDIEWVKLEYGDKPTPFIPRNYSEELRLCQRYYISGNSQLLGVVTHFNSSNLYYLMPLPVEMYKNPTIINPENMSVTGEKGELADATVGVVTKRGSTLHIAVTCSNHGLTNASVVRMYNNSGGKAHFDAEIY